MSIKLITPGTVNQIFAMNGSIPVGDAIHSYPANVVGLVDKNLLDAASSNFEDGTLGNWEVANYAVLSNDNSEYYSGSKCMKMVATNPWPMTSKIYVTDITLPMTTYTFSCMFKGVNGHHYHIEMYEDTSSIKYGDTVESDGNWLQLFITTTFANSVVYRMFRIQCDDCAASEASYWDSFQLELGPNITMYSPYMAVDFLGSKSPVFTHKSNLLSNDNCDFEGGIGDWTDSVIMKMLGDTNITEEISDTPFTMAGGVADDDFVGTTDGNFHLPIATGLLGAQAPVIAQAFTNLLAAEDASFKGNTVGTWLTEYNSPTVTVDATQGYHGTHCLKVVATANDGFSVHTHIEALAAAGWTGTASCRFKGKVGIAYQLYLYDNVAGAQRSADITADGTWQTLVVANKTLGVGSASRHITVYAETGTTGDTFYVDAVQLELGAVQTPFALPGATPSRTACKMTIPTPFAAGQPLTIMALLNTANLASQNTTYHNVLHSYGTDATHNLIELYADSTNDSFVLLTYDNVAGLRYTQDAGGQCTLTDNATYIVIATLAADNTQHLYVNGTELTSHSAAVGVRESVVPATISIGSRNTGGYPINGSILCAIWGRVLSAAEIAFLSALPAWSQLPRNALAYSSDQYYTGNRSLKITAGLDLNETARLNVTDETHDDKVYSAQAVIKGTLGKSYKLQMADNLGSTNGAAVTATGGWDLIQATRTFTDSSTMRELSILPDTAHVNGDILYVDSVKLENGEVLTPFTLGPANLLSENNSNFETSEGDWSGWFGTCTVAQSAIWANEGLNSLEITPINYTAVVLDITDETSSNETYQIKCHFKGVVGKLYWMGTWDDDIGAGGSSFLVVGDGTNQTLLMNVMFGTCTVRQMFIYGTATDPAEVTYIDTVIVSNGSPFITWSSDDIGLTAGNPVSIVCVINKPAYWNETISSHRLLFMSRGDSGDGFEVLASSLYGQIFILNWSGGSAKSRGIAIDSSNWSAGKHTIIGILDANNNQRLFVDGVEGFVTAGSCGRESELGDTFVIGTHVDNNFNLDGNELCAVYDRELTDNEIAEYSVITDWNDFIDIPEITVIGLEENQAVKLFDYNIVEVDSAVESSGSATLTFNYNNGASFNGFLVVYENNTYTNKYESYVHSNIIDGDIYQFESTPIISRLEVPGG